MTTETNETTETAAPLETAPAAVTPAPETPAATATELTLPELPVQSGPARAVGRRKSSTANCRIAPGEGKFLINGREIKSYFIDVQDQNSALRALEVVGGRRKWDVLVRVSGGGTTGQAGAVALALSRALLKAEPTLSPAIRAAGLMTRDARVKERKKYGRRGARRGFQFSKR